MSTNTDKAKKTLDKAVKIVAIFGLAGIAFAIWFSIQFAKSKTKEEFDKRQTYFNDIHENFNKDWAQNPYWDSVKTEESIYINAATSEEMIVKIEKQSFNDQFNVKSNTLERPDIYNVLNMSVRAGDADSSVRANMIYLCMNPLVLHKMTTSIADERGISFKSYFNNKSVITMKYDSYKDKEGTGDKVFEKDVMPLEQLMFSLRTMNIDSIRDFKLKVLEAQLKSGIGNFAIYNCDVRVKKIEDVVDVIVEFPNNTYCLYKLERAYPNKLISFNRFGQVFQLKK